jgi:hypothetical protein
MVQILKSELLTWSVSLWKYSVMYQLLHEWSLHVEFELGAKF